MPLATKNEKPATNRVRLSAGRRAPLWHSLTIIQNFHIMKNTHLPAVAGWQVFVCSLAKPLLSPCARFFQTTGKNYLAVFLVMLCTAGNLSSQTITWSGAINTDWNNAGNWLGGQVPFYLTKVIIPNTANDPVISSGVQVSNLTILSGAALTNNNVLTIYASSPDITFLNQGTLTNNGWIWVNYDNTILSTSSNIGLKNEGVINNNASGTIFIADATLGFWNVSGTVVCKGDIFIGSASDKGLWNASGTFDVQGSSAHLDVSGNTTCIYNEASFSNETGGLVDVASATLCGIHHVSGTFTNSGTIRIGSSNSTGTYGLKNSATFNNNTGGLINIGRAASFSLWNEGTFNNSANITMGYPGGAYPTGISNSGIFNNNAGGNIDIDRATLRGIINATGATFTNTAIIRISNPNLIFGPMNNGIENEAAFNNNGAIYIDDASLYGVWNKTGTFTNAATLHINADPDSENGTNGVRNTATFNNNAGAQININRVTESGIFNATGTFTNAATINIGNNAAGSTLYGIQNNAAFNNNGAGQIKIDRSTSVGIWNDAGTFTNAATLTIGSLAAVGLKCIYNEAAFNNNTGGVINADNSSQYGIENFTGTFTNAATIHIGSTSAVGTHGLRNSSTFNNNTGGQINIDRSTSIGLQNNAGTFTNKATLTIGSLAAVGSTGISNSAPFNNNAGGTITMDRSAGWGILNGSTFTNAATINIGTLAASSMIYGIQNNATFNNTGGQMNIDRFTSSGILTDAGTFTNQGSITAGLSVPGINLVSANTGTFSNSTGGTLKGTGIIAASNFTNAGGTLSPGYSPGLMLFVGDESFSNNTWTIEVNGKTTGGVDFDQVVVVGTATLGGTLALSINYTPSNGDQVTIFGATSAISGTFSTVTGLPANWQVSYTPSAVVLTFAAPLPVELVDFSARLMDDAVQLDWSTASEHNNEGFYIERRTATEGQWAEIGFVPGHGTSTESNDYTFLDEKPLPGLNYYRLRQVDFDGNREYSNIVKVEVEVTGSHPMLFPNPAGTAVQVQFPQEFSEGKLDLFDVAGRLVLSQYLETGSQLVPLQMTNLSSGTYLCRFQLDGVVFLERLQIR